MHYHYNQHHKYKNMQQLHQINPLKLKEAALKLRLIKTNWEILSLINNTPDMSQTDLVVILRKDHEPKKMKYETSQMAVIH